MNERIRRIAKATPFYQPLRDWAVRRRQAKEYDEWMQRGKPVPPPHLAKQRTLASYGAIYGLRVLVETGTYYGDMVEALKHRFDRVYSIELSRDLYELATRRFRGNGRIELIHGDSGVELGRLMPRLDRPALFWLDGHYSAGETARGERETPIFDELRHILGAEDRGHVLIVDDARLFGADPAYPSLEELSAFVRARRPAADITVEDDSIRITPARPGA